MKKMLIFLSLFLVCGVIKSNCAENIEYLDDARRPKEHFCPISLEVMRDPVIAADGITYERNAVNEWIRANGTSPITRERLSTANLTPNIAMRSIIRDWRPEEVASRREDRGEDEVIIGKELVIEQQKLILERYKLKSEIRTLKERLEEEKQKSDQYQMWWGKELENIKKFKTESKKNEDKFERNLAAEKQNLTAEKQKSNQYQTELRAASSEKNSWRETAEKYQTKFENYKWLAIRVGLPVVSSVACVVGYKLGQWIYEYYPNTCQDRYTN